MFLFALQPRVWGSICKRGTTRGSIELGYGQRSRGVCIVDHSIIGATRRTMSGTRGPSLQCGISFNCRGLTLRLRAAWSPPVLKLNRCYIGAQPSVCLCRVNRAQYPTSRRILSINSFPTEPQPRGTCGLQPGIVESLTLDTGDKLRPTVVSRQNASS